MKGQLEDELVIAMMPFIDEQNVSDIKMIISMTLGKYDVSRTETALTVYEGDVNDLIIRRWLAAKLAKGCSPNTIRAYRSSVSNTLARIGKAYMDVTADDVRLYLAERIYKDKVSKTAANNERRNLSAFYFWLQKEEILLKNPMNKVDVIKETKKKKQAFTPMEIEKIRYACRSARETAIIEIMLSTWCRVSELAEIKMSDINGGSVIVHGKGDKYRACYLSAKAQLAASKYLQERRDANPYLFPKAKYAGNLKEFRIKKPSDLVNWYMDPEMVDETEHSDKSAIETIVRNIGKRAEVQNTHPHRFRRTGATMALRSGMPLIQVSKLRYHAGQKKRWQRKRQKA